MRMKTVVDKVRVVYRIDGLRGVIAKAAGAPIAQASARRDFRRYSEWYANHLIFVAGLPKSGSTWLASMLASLPGFVDRTPSVWAASMLTDFSQDLSDDIFAEFRRQLVVVKGHTRGTEDNVAVLDRLGAPYLVLLRDPRDQLISSYWYLRNRPKHRRHHLVAGRTLDEYIKTRLVDGSFDDQILAWIRLWAHNRSELALIARYEDLVDSPAEGLQSIFRHLGFSVAASSVGEIVERHSFRNTTGRLPGDEDVSAFARKGQPGEWEEVFGVEERELFARIGEDVIESGGWKPTQEM